MSSEEKDVKLSLVNPAKGGGGQNMRVILRRFIDDVVVWLCFKGRYWLYTRADTHNVYIYIYVVSRID